MTTISNSPSSKSSCGPDRPRSTLVRAVEPAAYSGIGRAFAMEGGHIAVFYNTNDDDARSSRAMAIRPRRSTMPVMAGVVAPQHLGPADLPFSPAAERNTAPILALLRTWLPSNAIVLEVASGTGQHAQQFAAAQPGWEWQPSDARDEALPVIATRCATQTNVRQPLRLDVQITPWPVQVAAFDAVFVANLLHIAPWEATPALLNNAARCLRDDGVLIVYGPFIVDAEPLAPSNAAFDTDLRMRDARWGLRTLQQIRDAARDAGLVLAECRAMPANNLMLRLGSAS